MVEEQKGQHSKNRKLCELERAGAKSQGKARGEE